MNPYYYLYYKIYKFTSRLGKWEVAESAAYGMTMLLGINLIALLSYFLNDFFYDDFITFKTIIAVFGIGLFFVNTLLFVYKKRYLKIIEKYQSESRLQSKIGGAIVILYVIATFVTLFL